MAAYFFDSSALAKRYVAEKLTLISADLELNSASIAEGLIVYDPNTR